jgi:hypothetical protein
MPLKSGLSAFVIASVVLATTGCASYPKTIPLKAYNLAEGYRFEQLPPGLRVTKTPGKNSDKLFVVLAFPILLPLLVCAINGCVAAFTCGQPGDLRSNLTVLSAYLVAMVTASLLLFEYVWEA